MRDRLGDWCCFLYLAHMTSRNRVGTWLESKTRLEAEFDVRPCPIDFELLHYSAGVGLRVMADENIIRMETIQNCFCCFK
jgi:hypothetical protein